MLTALALAAAFPPVPVLPNTDYYVDAQAACATADGSAAAPFCDIASALAVTVDGDRVLVAPGTYTEWIVVGTDIEIIGTGGRDVTEIDAVGQPHVVTVQPSANVRFEGLSFRGASNNGLTVRGDIELDRCSVTDCVNGGIDVLGSGSRFVASDCVIARNVRTSSPGAGVFVDELAESATLTRCQILDNTHGFEGSGIYSESDLALVECTIAGNTAAVSGAGVMVFLGDLAIDSCLIHDNEALAFGAGLYYGSFSATVQITNTTISGNRLLGGFGGGAGAYLDGGATGRLENCTITENAGAPGAGLLLLTPDVLLHSSIVSGNTSPSGADDIQGTTLAALQSGGHNVIGDTVNFGSVSSDVLVSDPLLFPLACNGGSTRTHAPRPGSPCLGLHPGGGPAVDARGAARSGSSLESGAFEVIGAPAFCDGQPNSTLVGANLQASGDIVAGAGRFSLHASNLPADVFGFFLVGDATQSMVPANSQGTFCVGGNVGRFDRAGLSEIMNSGADGNIALHVDLDDVPAVMGTETLVAGDTRVFQLWYRDENPGGTSNFSSAVSVTFE